MSVQHSSREGLQFLDTLRYDALLTWLERALRGREPLPLLVPDESPECAILRERRISRQTRADLESACLTLVSRFVSDPRDKDDYVLALLRLSAGQGIPDVAPRLQGLTEDNAKFVSLSSLQRWAVVSTLFDLRAPLPADFWRMIAERYPAELGVLAIAGLLTSGPGAAFGLLRLLPNDEAVADALYVALDQHARRLNPGERQKMLAVALQVKGDCQPEIQAALQDLLPTHEPVLEVSTERSSRLDTALAAFASREDRVYQRRPRSARLIPVATS